MLRDDWENWISSPFGGWTGGGMNKMDMYETESELVVELEAPGFKKEDIDISVENNVITISGKRVHNEEKQNKKKKEYYKEVSEESFARSENLPVRVKAEEASAEFKDGIVIVIMPKATEELSKKIAIK